MKSGYEVETYAEAFDAHNEFTGAIHPEGLAAEFRGICEDADKEIFALRQRVEDAEDIRSDFLDATGVTMQDFPAWFSKVMLRIEDTEVEAARLVKKWSDHKSELIDMHSQRRVLCGKLKEVKEECRSLLAMAQRRADERNVATNERDTAINRLEQAENVLRYIADQRHKGMAGNWAVNQALTYFSTAQDANPRCKCGSFKVRDNRGQWVCVECQREPPREAS